MHMGVECMYYYLYLAGNPGIGSFPPRLTPHCKATNIARNAHGNESLDTVRGHTAHVDCIVLKAQSTGGHGDRSRQPAELDSEGGEAVPTPPLTLTFTAAASVPSPDHDKRRFSRLRSPDHREMHIKGGVK